MTEFERKVLEYLEWKRGQASRLSFSDIIVLVFGTLAVGSIVFAEIIPLFLD